MGDSWEWDCLVCGAKVRIIRNDYDGPMFVATHGTGEARLVIEHEELLYVADILNYPHDRLEAWLRALHEYEGTQGGYDGSLVPWPRPGSSFGL